MIDLTTMKPRAIEGYLRDVILKTLGDKIENESSVTSRRGRYTVEIDTGGWGLVEFKNFRKSEAKKIAKAIRALK